jgi:NAD dependent epimerase/dehydratase family enzyme
MMGEMSIEVLKSATVSSAKISQAGFTFLYPAINPAMEKEAQPR